MEAAQFDEVAFQFGWTEALSDAAASQGPEQGVSPEATPACMLAT